MNFWPLCFFENVHRTINSSLGRMEYMKYKVIKYEGNRERERERKKRGHTSTHVRGTSFMFARAHHHHPKLHLLFRSPLPRLQQRIPLFYGFASSLSPTLVNDNNHRHQYVGMFPTLKHKHMCVALVVVYMHLLLS